jgi:hypothetical protein
MSEEYEEEKKKNVKNFLHFVYCISCFTLHSIKFSHIAQRGDGRHLKKKVLSVDVRLSIIQHKSINRRLMMNAFYSVYRREVIIWNCEFDKQF